MYTAQLELWQNHPRRFSQYCLNLFTLIANISKICKYINLFIIQLQNQRNIEKALKQTSENNIEEKETVKSCKVLFKFTGKEHVRSQDFSYGGKHLCGFPRAQRIFKKLRKIKKCIILAYYSKITKPSFNFCVHFSRFWTNYKLLWNSEKILSFFW